MFILDLILKVMNQIDHCLKEINKKVIGLIKDESGRTIMKKIVRLRAKTYSYLIDDGSEDKKSKRHKKVCHKNKNLNLKTAKTVQKQLNLRMK